MMLAASIKISFILVGFVSVTSLGESMIGPGVWRVLSVEQCEGEYPVLFAPTQRKVNRTHDGFSVQLDYDKPLDDSHAIRIEICKHVDGGCKPYSTLSDESLPRFVNKFAGDNLRAFLQLADVDPPEFPVPAGPHEVRNFVFNYKELPRESIYGSFGARAYVMHAARDVCCVRLDADFVEDDEGEGEDR